MNTCTFGIEIEQDLPVESPDHWTSKEDGSVRSRLKNKSCSNCGYYESSHYCPCERYNYTTHTYAPVRNCESCHGTGSIVCENHNGRTTEYFDTEHVSPVIYGRGAFEQEMIKSLEWSVSDTNETCGLHVHIGHDEINLAMLADSDDQFADIIVNLNNDFYNWVVENDPNRDNNGYCPHRNTLGWRVRNAPYDARRVERGYGSCLLRRIGTIEFRSPSPRLDRQALADRICHIAKKIEEYIDEKNLSVR